MWPLGVGDNASVVSITESIARVRTSCKSLLEYCRVDPLNSEYARHQAFLYVVKRCPDWEPESRFSALKAHDALQ